jgi:hypothetical protein
MKTCRLLTKESGRLFAFEVENIYIPPAMAARLLTDVNGVTDVELRRVFSESSDIHVEFRYRGRSYIVWEPYGDSSRYWIGPKEDEIDGDDIASIEAAFKRYRPPVHRRLLGDVVTLRFLTRLFNRDR